MRHSSACLTTLRRAADHTRYLSPLTAVTRQDFISACFFRLGDILVTWEAGKAQKERESEILKQGIVFETFAELLPEMIMEIDTQGHVTFMNTQGMLTLGFDNNDLARGVTLSGAFPSCRP